MLVFSSVQMTSPSYGDYQYPEWAKAIGWSVAMLSVIPMPLVAVIQIYRAKGSLMQASNYCYNLHHDADKGNKSAPTLIIHQMSSVIKMYKSVCQKCPMLDMLDMYLSKHHCHKYSAYWLFVFFWETLSS